VTIGVSGDTDIEMDEGFTVTLSNPTNGAVLGTADAGGSILNDDSFNPVCPAAGDLVITEIIQNPSAVGDSNGEWFEVYNPTGMVIDMNGMIVRDAGGDSHTIVGTLNVPAGGYVVLGINADMTTNGGVTVDYEYSGISLGNGADEVIIECSGTVIDSVGYDGGPNFPDPNGASMNLDPGQLTATANDDGANWCEATTSYGDGDSGTPGMANDACGGGSVPSCTNLTAPANGAVEFSPAGTLTWAAATGDLAGYKLTIGTTPGGTEILDNVDVGTVTTYDPAGYLPYDATVYVTIVPFNGNGDAMGCTEESFATADCIPDLMVVADPILEPLHKSLGELNSNSSRVEAGTMVDFRSDVGIVLSADFTVEIEAEFTAEIEACGGN
jgi:hypothetical protein